MFFSNSQKSRCSYKILLINIIEWSLMSYQRNIAYSRLFRFDPHIEIFMLISNIIIILCLFSYFEAQCSYKMVLIEISECSKNIVLLRKHSIPKKHHIQAPKRIIFLDNINLMTIPKLFVLFWASMFLWILSYKGCRLKNNQLNMKVTK